MTNDMLNELYHILKENETLRDVTVKSFIRPESLKPEEDSVVIIPIIPPTDDLSGSNKALRKRFLYQVNCESKDRVRAKELQQAVQQSLLQANFYQTSGGLDEYISDLNRYVDARTYRGYSDLYNSNY